MHHSPIVFEQLSLVFQHKICFDAFNGRIAYGDKIAILGRNGSGKTSLLKMILGDLPASGKIIRPADLLMAYVPQMLETEKTSGAERFQKALTAALATQPNCLLLDEPTNHLDQKNFSSLQRFLENFDGTLIMVTHDQRLLETMSSFWKIDQGIIQTHQGKYADYVLQKQQQKAYLERKLKALQHEKQAVHQQRMKEQQRAKKRKAYGEKKYNGDKLALRSAQGSGEITHARHIKSLNDQRQGLLEELSQLKTPPVILPNFSIMPIKSFKKTLISLQNATCGYDTNNPLLENISFQLHTRSRTAIEGENKSGKTTLIKAVMGNPTVMTKGEWILPKLNNIGYLDQHYLNLPKNVSVIDILQTLVPHWSHTQLRQHLGTFLFFKNEEVSLPVDALSGGEKARLSLALIAAKTPALLILDEITNNLDRETKEHVSQILRAYPGALCVISHDKDFSKIHSYKRMVYHSK